MAAEKPGSAAPLVFVRGQKTTTGAEDRRRAAYRNDVERRRAASDRKNQVLRASAAGDPTAGVAREFNRKLAGSREHLVVILNALNRDGTVLDYIVCELNMVDGSDGLELSLQMVCPRCVFNLGRTVDEAQIHIRQSNRKFYLDTNSSLANQPWINPNDRNEVYTQAGEIHLEEWATCPNEGCGFRFKIGQYQGRGLKKIKNCIVPDWL